MKCSATTRNGTPCRLKAVEGGLCRVHQPSRLAIIQALRGPFRKSLGNLETWENWQAILAAVWGEKLSPKELGTFQAVTGREAPRAGGYDEAFLLIGRGGGKTTTCALAASYTALFSGLEKKVAEGESIYIFCLADTLAQASICHDSIRRFLRPFARMIKREAREEIELNNGFRIVTKAADEKSLRGWRLGLVVLDEADFFDTDLDRIIAALSPSIVEGGKLLAISSRGPRNSPLSKIADRYWATDSSTLVVKAPTGLMNPTFSQKKIDRDIGRDSRMAREYNPLAVDDSGLFAEASLRAVSTIRGDEPRVDAARYVAFIDAASNADAMALAIAYVWNEKARVAAVREVPAPYDPLKVLDDFADLIDRYHVRETFADRYAFSLVESALRKRQIVLTSFKPSSTDCYFKLKALIEMDAVELPADDRFIREILSLEVVRTGSGQERIEHPKHAHDDLASATAAAVFTACASVRGYKPVAAEATMTQRITHPDPIREKEIDFEEEKENCENELIDDLEKDFGPLCLPIVGGRPVILTRRK
ncbi:MAG: hypothetical protein ABR951_10030 [Candidatus Aminicenantales bacterium]|jgi:hypothetical protein